MPDGAEEPKVSSQVIHQLGRACGVVGGATVAQMFTLLIDATAATTLPRQRSVKAVANDSSDVAFSRLRAVPGWDS